MKRTFLIIFVIAIIFCSGCSGDGKNINYVEINPMSVGSAKDTTYATLYYRLAGSNTLVSEDREIETALNERLEVAVVNELIQGPEYGNSELERLINPATKVINISDSGDFLFVTLSKEFLEEWDVDNAAQPDSEEVVSKRNERLRLAVYSITNTLIEYSGYPRVQILVDRDGSGNGKRVQLYEVGFTGTGTLEPLAWNGDIIQSVKNTARDMLAAVNNKNWEQVYKYIAYNDENDTPKPSQDEFIQIASAREFTVESYEIVDYITTKESGKATVIVNFNVNAKDGQARRRTNIPIQFILENSVWKVTYLTFKNLFLS